MYQQNINLFDSNDNTDFKIKQLENQINDMTGELERKDNNSNRLISEKQQLIDLLKGKG